MLARRACQVPYNAASFGKSLMSLPNFVTNVLSGLAGVSSKCKPMQKRLVPSASTTGRKAKSISNASPVFR